MGINVHKLHTMCGPLVHASGVHGGVEHSARRAKNIENGIKWPKLGTFMVGTNGAHVQLGPVCALESVSSPMCATYLVGFAQTRLYLGMAGSPSEPMTWDLPKLPTL